MKETGFVINLFAFYKMVSSSSFSKTYIVINCCNIPCGN